MPNFDRLARFISKAARLSLLRTHEQVVTFGCPDQLKVRIRGILLGPGPGNITSCSFKLTANNDHIGASLRVLHLYDDFVTPNDFFLEKSDVSHFIIRHNMIDIGCMRSQI